MTSIFSSSWMCRLCGREACAECFEQVKDLTEDKPGASQAEIAALQARREKHAHSNPFFLSCTRRNEHHAKDFSPMSRFCKAELAQAIKDMEAMLREPDTDALPDAGPINPLLQVEQAQESGGTLSSAQAPDSQIGGEASASAPEPSISSAPQHGISQDGVFHSESVPVTASSASQVAEPPLSAPVAPPSIDQNSAPSSEIPSHPTTTITDSQLTEEVFRPLWAKGDPIVVTELLSKFQIQWTPEYFVQKYTSQSCLILECQSDVNKRVTVGEFFSWFGKYEGRVECWKLKVRSLSAIPDTRLVCISRIGHHQQTLRLHFLNCLRISVGLYPCPIMFVGMEPSILPHISLVIRLHRIWVSIAVTTNQSATY
jgi:lysine-specific demethylase 3